MLNLFLMKLSTLTTTRKEKIMRKKMPLPLLFFLGCFILQIMFSCFLYFRLPEQIPVRMGLFGDLMYSGSRDSVFAPSVVSGFLLVLAYPYLKGGNKKKRRIINIIALLLVFGISLIYHLQLLKNYWIYYLFKLETIQYINHILIL